jgi:Transglutaminase-like superfamily
VRLLKTLSRLTIHDWRLFAGAFVMLVVCRARLRCQNFAAVRAWAAHKGKGAAPINRLTWSIEAASKRMKGATCLSKALALQRMLAQNGHDSELRIGVDKSGGLFTSHAWLVHRERILVGGSEIENHTLLAAWTASESREGNG